MPTWTSTGEAPTIAVYCIYGECGGKRREISMQFNVAQLLKEPVGSVRRYQLNEEADALDEDLEFLSPLVGNLQIMRTNSGVLVTGTFTVGHSCHL